MTLAKTLATEPSRENSSTAIDRIARHPLGAGVTAAVLLWCAFPPVEWSWLAWVGLSPLFALVRQPGPRWKSYLAAWLGGAVYWLLTLQWVRLTDASAWLAWVVMALIFSAWWPGFLALARMSMMWLRLPLMLAAPILWVGLEHLRAYILTGFPWYYLGHSQYRSLILIQVADITSSLGISFLIALVNAWVVDLLTLPLLRRSPEGPRLTRLQARRGIIVLVLFVVTLGYGSYRLSTARFRQGPKLALLQTNFEQRYKWGGDPARIVEKIQGLISTAVAASRRPDLIVWPETSYPYGFIRVDEATPSEALGRQVRSIGETITVQDWIAKRSAIEEHLRGLSDSTGVPMLVGSILYDHRPDRMDKFNSAILFEPARRTIQAYHKIHLVPFGEFVPFIQSLPFLTIFTPYRDGSVPSLTFGTEPLTIALGEYRIAVAICFEDTVPHIVRRFFHELTDGRQPDLLLNISNDGWFHGSSELDMHLAVSVFRTIENRTPLVRCVNTGISALVDGNGEIRDTLPRLTDKVLNVTVPLDDRTSFYIRWGDWLGLSCLAVTIGLVPLGAYRRLRS